MSIKYLKIFSEAMYFKISFTNNINVDVRLALKIVKIKMILKIGFNGTIGNDHS
jgi:hypothetical protein